MLDPHAGRWERLGLRDAAAITDLETAVVLDDEGGLVVSHAVVVPPLLDDLPRAARRFARWRANVMSRALSKKTRRLWPLRPGRAPGLPSRRTHEVHEILSVVHGLAFWSLERRDTS